MPSSRVRSAGGRSGSGPPPPAGCSCSVRRSAASWSTRSAGGSRFDWLGALAVALAVGGLAYGAIRGYATLWADPTAIIGLVVGAVFTVALIPLMTRRRNVLVPPALFRSRNFTVTNISTLLIYGALYVYSYFFAVFVQGVLGYTATASGLAGIVISVALVALSTTFGQMAGRRGPRFFMSVGPAIMALGLLWYLRIPPDSSAWQANITDPATLLPSSGYLVDILPSVVLFAFGLSMLVALLATAVIFIAVSASFYAGLEQRVPGIDTSSPEVRHELPPLNPPGEGASDAERAAARESSTDAFRLAMLIDAVLCAAGAAVNWVGIRRSEDLGAPRGEVDAQHAAGA